MEPYFWLVIIALVATLLTTFVSLGNVKVPNPGKSRLIALLAAVSSVLLIAAVIWFAVSGLQVTIVRV